MPVAEDHPRLALPKDGLVREFPSGSIELRAAEPDDESSTMPKLTGYMLRFNEATEIDSIFEGRFIEEIAPGAARKSLRENQSMRVLFNHGHDPSIGEKPIAEPRFLEDTEGVRYDEPELFDADYVRELVPALRAGQLGSSFKFRVTREEIDEEPEKSETNPDGIPERRITELRLYEGGPVTFPAYEGSSAGARSLADQFFIEALRLSHSPELDEIVASWIADNPERCEELLLSAREAMAESATTSKSTAPIRAEEPPHPDTPPKVTEDPRPLWTGNVDSAARFPRLP